jgi:hypothetical protein
LSAAPCTFPLQPPCLFAEGLRPGARALSASNRTADPSPAAARVAFRVPGRNLIPRVPLDRSAATE